MLVLTRRLGEKLILGDGIIVTVIEVKGNRVRIGIDAPDQVCVLRGELAADEAHLASAPDLESKPLEWQDRSSAPVVPHQ